MTDKGKTLLVVDDEAVLRELEVQILESSGCRVLEAGGVAEALPTLASGCGDSAHPPIAD